jgi:hypothetical protein
MPVVLLRSFQQQPVPPVQPRLQQRQLDHCLQPRVSAASGRTADCSNLLLEAE